MTDRTYTTRSIDDALEQLFVRESQVRKTPMPREYTCER
jgi:hypothetical protein